MPARELEPILGTVVRAYMDDKREILTIKIRRKNAEGEAKSGFKIRIAEELLDDMEEVPKGGEYPECLVMNRDKMELATRNMHGIAKALAGETDVLSKHVERIQRCLERNQRVFGWDFSKDDEREGE